MVSFLVIALTLLLPFISCDEAPQCDSGPIPYTNCFSECGFDRNGGDLRSLRTTSLFECARECDLDPLCLDAQFNRQSQFCYLKKEFTGGRFDDLIDGVICQKGLPPAPVSLNEREQSPDFGCWDVF